MMKTSRLPMRGRKLRWQSTGRREGRTQWKSGESWRAGVGEVESWRGGEVERRRYEELGSWRGGEAERWRGGEVESWRGGEAERRRGGEAESWRGGELERWPEEAGHWTLPWRRRL
jgi:hypothetical protein